MSDLSPFDCAYPRCPAPEASKLTLVAGKIAMCQGCGRMMAACSTRKCQSLGTYNRPFVKHCRRCGSAVDQAESWEKARQDGWNLLPRSFGDREVINDLSRLVDSAVSGRSSVAVAMIRGSLAIHHAGHSLTLLKGASEPRSDETSILWLMDLDPFSAPPGSPDRHAFTPALLPGERYLMYSGPQGVLILDLWSCQGLSAKDNDPRVRMIRLEERSLVAPPVALDQDRLGLLTRSGSREAERRYHWTIWDRSTPIVADVAFSKQLDIDDSSPLPIRGNTCSCQVVDDRVIALSTEREQWVWRMADAAGSMRRTWPRGSTSDGSSIVLDNQGGFLSSTNQMTQAFLLKLSMGGSRHRAVERFTWFSCVRRGGHSQEESVERYEVDFDSLDSEIPQQINLRSGARPIGAASDRNEIRQMYFRVGTEIWYQHDGPTASHYQGGLPQTIVSHQISGPLVVSVGEKDQGTRFIQVDSLHHRGAHADFTIEPETRLLSDPLLWNRWLFTVEVDSQGRFLVCRRTVDFQELKV